jgi:hypothetical protein
MIAVGGGQWAVGGALSIGRDGRSKNIFHFSFSIFHSTFSVGALQQWKMVTDK